MNSLVTALTVWGVALVMAVVGFFLFDDGNSNNAWFVDRSPLTGMCYEFRELNGAPLAYGMAMALIDDSYCEDK